jgi:hypothetical protein
MAMDIVNVGCAETMKKLHEVRRSMDTAPMQLYDIDQFVSAFERDENSPVTAPPYQSSTHEPSSSAHSTWLAHSK